MLELTLHHVSSVLLCLKVTMETLWKQVWYFCEITRNEGHKIQECLFLFTSVLITYWLSVSPVSLLWSLGLLFWKGSRAVWWKNRQHGEKKLPKKGKLDSFGLNSTWFMWTQGWLWFCFMLWTIPNTIIKIPHRFSYL